MKIGVLGTGMVGQAIAGKLAALGHEVKMGAREAANEKAQAWAKSAGPRASHGTFADAAAFGEIVFHCALGTAALDVIAAAGAANLAGKVLVDVSNPLDFSQMPPTLFTGPADSLGDPGFRLEERDRSGRHHRGPGDRGLSPALAAPLGSSADRRFQHPHRALITLRRCSIARRRRATTPRRPSTGHLRAPTAHRSRRPRSAERARPGR